MNLNDVMAQEREALMAEYLFPQGIQVPPYCAVPDIETLKSTPSALRARYPVSIDRLEGERAGKGFVQICAGLRYKFLWTHVDNDKYRSDYVGFISKYYGLQLTDLPQNLHVDHLYNRTRARNMQLPFVRMVLLPNSINMSHGAAYEKQRTMGAIGTPGNQRGIDEIVLMKLWGVPSPRKDGPITPLMQGHLNRMAARFGIPVAELERNIRELMDVAAFRPPGK